MRYTVTTQVVQVIGNLWMPDTVAAMQYSLSPYDLANMDPKNRDDVERWVMLHTGDFQNIIDFRADFTIDDKSVIHEWANEESESTYSDCMFPSDD